MAVTGRIVGADGVAAAYGDGRGIPRRQTGGDAVGKIVHLRHIGVVGTTGAQCAGKAVLSHKGRACHAGKAVGGQQLRQLHQGVVIISVAEQRHGDGQRSRAVHHVPQVGHQQIGHAARVGGAAHHRQIARRDGQFPLSGVGQGIAVLSIGRAQLVRQTAGNAADGLFRGAGTAEIHGVNGRNEHGAPSFSCAGRQT